MLTTSQLVNYLVVLTLLLSNVTKNIENQIPNQNDLSALTKHLNKINLELADEDCAELVPKVKTLKERLLKVLETESPLVELKSLKEEIPSLVSKEQLLFEATRLAEELGSQKNANTSLSKSLKKADSEKTSLSEENTSLSEENTSLSEALKKAELNYKKEKAVADACVKNFKKQVEHFEENKKQLQAEQNVLAVKLFEEEQARSAAEKRVNAGVEIIRRCQQDIQHDTMAYTYLEAEAEYYKQRGNYYKSLAEAVNVLAPERENHAMSKQDKKEDIEIGWTKAPLDSKYMIYENAVSAYKNAISEWEKFKATTRHATQNKEELEDDPDLLEAIRLSQEAMVQQSQNKEETKEEIKEELEDPSLAEALRISQIDVGTGPATSTSQQDFEDPDLAEALRLSLSQNFK